MSLIFKSKIPKAWHFASGKYLVPTKMPLRVVISWTNQEIEKLIALRALGISYKKCAQLLGRTQNSVTNVTHDRDLYIEVDARRKELIDEIIS